MSKNRCRAVCITRDSKLIRARRDHHHPAHWNRFANRELFTTEQDIDGDPIMYTLTQSLIQDKTVIDD